MSPGLLVTNSNSLHNTISHGWSLRRSLSLVSEYLDVMMSTQQFDG